MRSAFALQAEAALNAVTADLEGAKADRIAAYARLSALAGVEETFTGLSESLLAVPVAAPTYGPVDPMTSSSRSEEHTSELQSLMRISYAVFCLKKQKQNLPQLPLPEM